MDADVMRRAPDLLSIFHHQKFGFRVLRCTHCRPFRWELNPQILRLAGPPRDVDARTLAAKFSSEFAQTLQKTCGQGDRRGGSARAYLLNAAPLGSRQYLAIAHKRVRLAQS